MKPTAFAAVLLLASALAHAETVKDREGAVRGDRAAMEKNERWIYNDWRRGLEMAKWSGKPLLVVLRCVPCLACAGIDAGVLNEPELQPLLDKFVCVRVINANDLDLSLFQVDYDLSFSTVFFNADGTVYGRYGSWTHQKNALDKTTAGFRRALEGALALHRAYPANRPALAGKQGAAMPFKTTLEIPSLAAKYKRDLDWEGKVVQSCVHCHQVGDAVRANYRKARQPIPTEWIYPWPAPETIGLTLATDSAARVQHVAANSAAAKSGFKADDEIISLAGQPLLSVADVSWVLHRARDTASLPALVKRGGKQMSLTLALPAGWRAQADISRRVGTWPMRAMAFGGLLLEDLGAEERTQRGLDANVMALLVKHAGEYGEHAAAKKAGFRKGDVLVSLDGKSARVTESELLGQVLRSHPPGAKLKATVLRGSERVELNLPVQ